MEIKQEKKSGGRTRFLWLLLLVNIVLIAGIWQYHRLIVEVSDGAAADLYRNVLNPFKRNEGIRGQSLKVALVQSEATAASFGDNKAGYYNLISMWKQLMVDEEFGYQIVNQVPRGEDAERFNLLLLPATRCMGVEDRDAVKAFLRTGKGVLMTWATGTRDEFGQWERFSLLNEVGGMDIVDPAPVSRDKVSTIMLSGGYPITANLYPGMILNITAFDQPISCFVREDRTLVDGVWSNPDEPTFALHSVRDRAAVTHGTYLDGRFVWTGFTIGSGQNQKEQRDAFRMLLRSSMLWAGHQIHAFKPVWPDGRLGVLSITQDILGPTDVDSHILDLMQKNHVKLTSFVSVDALKNQPDLMSQLVSAGEVGLLGNPGADYEGRSLDDQIKEFDESRKRLKMLTGRFPVGFRLPDGQPYSDHTLDALVRTGFSYISVRDLDRMVPKAARSYRRIALITQPRTLWEMPETVYMRTGLPNVNVENTMLAHFSQILALGGYYCLSFRPSMVNGDFVSRLGELMETAERKQVLISTVFDVTTFWEGWDHIKIGTRLISPERTSLKISNTWVDPVKDVIVNVEMPSVQRQLDIESMTLGTELPDSMSNSGVRWKLYLKRLGPGKNVIYYLNLKHSNEAQSPPQKPSGTAAGEVW